MANNQEHIWGLYDNEKRTKQLERIVSKHKDVLIAFGAIYFWQVFMAIFGFVLLNKVPIIVMVLFLALDFIVAYLLFCRYKGLVRKYKEEDKKQDSSAIQKDENS